MLNNVDISEIFVTSSKSQFPLGFKYEVPLLIDAYCRQCESTITVTVRFCSLEGNREMSEKLIDPPLPYFHRFNSFV